MAERVAFPFAGDLVGGSHVSAAHLIHRLDRARYEPLVLLHRADGPVAELLAAEGIPFEPAPSTVCLGCASPLRDLTVALREARALAADLRRRRVRIVHTNDGRGHATWALPAWLAGARLLWHHRKDPDARGLRLLAPVVADRVVSVSRFAAPRPGWFSAARKSVVVHSPFDTEAPTVDRAATRAMLIDELGCPADSWVVGYFGSLERRKRPLTFIDTIAELCARVPDQPIVAPVFGHDLEGLEARMRARAAAAGIADRVRFMGFRYPGADWLAACDVLLVTAVNEPFGRTLIEAMLVGTVVVAADSGGNPEAIEDRRTGHLVPPDQPAGFAARIIEAMADRFARDHLTTAARRQACATFGLQRHADAIMQVYDDLLAPPPRRSRFGFRSPRALAGSGDAVLTRPGR